MHRTLTKQEFKAEYGFLPVHDPGAKTKPAGCLGCPLYGNGKGFVPDELRHDADVLILLQNPGKTEEDLGIPACGKTGATLNTTYLPLAGLTREKVSVANILKCRWGNSNTLPEGDVLDQAVRHCTEAHLRVPASTKLVILQGALAYTYATRDKQLYKPDGKPATITDWRGYYLPHPGRFRLADGGGRGTGESLLPLYGTIHLADTLRDSTSAWVAERDWSKVAHHASRRGGNTGPHSDTVRDRFTHDHYRWFERAAASEYIVIDTEFVGHGPGHTGRLTICGIYASDPSRGQQDPPVSTRHSGDANERGGSVIQFDARSATSHSYSEFARNLRSLIAGALRDSAGRRPVVVFHNAIADIPVLEQAFGIRYEDYAQVEDTMLAHAVLWCELPHDLEFLASYYGKYGKFKHLRMADELLYNYGDVVDTAAVYDAMVEGFRRDRLAEGVYREQSLKLIPILLDARKRGIRVNKRRVLEVFAQYHSLAGQVERIAQAASGYALNLKSGDQVRDYLYNERRYPVQINKATKRPSTDDDAIAKLRNTVSVPFDPDKEISLSTDDDRHYSILGRIQAGADAVLEARVLYAQTFHVLNNYILGLCKGVYGEQNAAKKKRAREHYWKVGITEDDIVDRVYPNFAIHAQKTGRWSTTGPPLAQLPADLRDIICPDEDEVCISWDWKAVEPRVLQALCGSRLLKKTFDDNFDLHTWTVCFMFGYEYPSNLVDPHKNPADAAWRAKYNWKGKDDPRRVFAKQGRYEMWYGGSGANAAQSAAQFGLDPKLLKAALNRLLSSDPDYYAWKIRTEAEVARTAVVRTFMGRPRRFLSKGDARRREGLDQPMQGAVSDIFNTTIVLLAQKFPALRWGWGMHDSQKWYVKAESLTPELLRNIKAVVERVHHVGGSDTVFPGDFELLLPPERGEHEVDVEEFLAGRIGLPVYVEPRAPEPEAMSPLANVG